MKKKRGRPPSENPATDRLPLVRVTPKQRRIYRDAAAKENTPLASWIKGSLDVAANEVMDRSAWYEEWIDDAQQAHQSSLEVLGKCKFDFSHPRHLAVGLLATTLLETADTIIVNAKMAIERPLLPAMRVMYERSIRLRFIAMEPKLHPMLLELDSSKSLLKALSNSQLPTSDEQNKEREKKKLEDRVLKLENDVRRYTSTAKILSASTEYIVRKLYQETRDSMDTYDYYRFLSQHEHGNLHRLSEFVVQKLGKNIVQYGARLSDRDVEILWSQFSWQLSHFKQSLISCGVEIES